jgi:hypothetical protein
MHSIFKVHILVPHNNNQGTERGGNVFTVRKLDYCLWHEAGKTNPRAVEVPGTNFVVEATIRGPVTATCVDGPVNLR